MKLELVPLEEHHLPGLLQVERESFSLPWSEQSFQEELNNPNAVYFAAVWEGTVTGYGGFWNILGEGHITNIAVLPRYRRQRLGSRIVQQLIKEALCLKLSLLTLEVRESNRAARGLYEKYGFSVLGRRKRYYSDNQEDALIMTKQLTERDGNDFGYTDSGN